MQSVTLFVAIVAGILIFLLRPIYGLVVLVASLAWYPTYLAVTVGTLDFTVRRIVILAVFAKLFLLTDFPQRFRFIWLDKLILLYFAAQLVAGATTATSLTVFVENRAGVAFDMVLPYFAVRVIINKKSQYLLLLKGILVISAPLAIVSFYESFTGHNPFGFLREYSAWSLHGGINLARRHGFYRAMVIFSHPIMLGLFFAMFGPICLGLFRNNKGHNLLCAIGIVFMAIGIFSSMSSGPMLAAFLAIPFIAFWHWRRYWKPVVMLIIIMCGSVEVISNRHFYDVLADFALDPHTAWYRSKLIDVALFEGGMSGHWLTGFGYSVDPGWGTKIDGRGHTDVVNHYIAVLIQFGLVGLVPFLAVVGAGMKRLIDSFRICATECDTWLVWCLSGSLLGTLIALNGTMLFGPPMTVFYTMLAFCGVMPKLITQANRTVAYCTANDLDNGRVISSVPA